MLVKKILPFIACCFFIISICSCGEAGKQEQQNSTNTFYVEYIASDQSFVKGLVVHSSGKASFFDADKKLLIVPVSYLPGIHNNTHYFIAIEDLHTKPPVNSIKYQVRFNNKYKNDSIAYTLQKFVYNENGWKLKSDMGEIKPFNYLADYDKNLEIRGIKIVEDVLKTIAMDSYSL